MDSKHFTLTPAFAKALQLVTDVVKFGLGDTSEGNLVRTYVHASVCADGKTSVIFGLGVRLADRITCALSHNARGHIKVNIGFIAGTGQNEFNQICAVFDKDSAEMVHWNVRNHDPEGFQREASPEVFVEILDAYRHLGWNVERFVKGGL